MGCTELREIQAVHAQFCLEKINLREELGTCEAHFVKLT